MLPPMHTRDGIDGSERFLVTGPEPPDGTGGQAGGWEVRVAMRRWTFLLIPVALVAAGVAIFLATRAAPPPAYRLARVEYGSLLSAISATGTLAPVTTVQVGSQVSGKIKELFVDFNSAVKRGDLIARIDSETFAARVRQAEAEVVVAKANIAMQDAAAERAKADLANARATLAAAEAQAGLTAAALDEASRDLARKDPLFKRGIVSGSEFERARSARDQATARVAEARSQISAQTAQIDARIAALQMAVAQVETAKAQVVQREAALAVARIDFENTFIRSPVDGIVIDRAVDIGQTVAASLQAPVLFQIAQDLSGMQVEVSVDEADIGRIVRGQGVIFTVDAFPGQEFSGRVEQVRKASKVIQNVVTYTVVVTVDNSGGRLLPGMTANVQIIVDRRDGTLKVMNSALRVRPSAAAASREPSAAEADRRQASPGPDRQGGAAAGDRTVARLGQALDLSAEQRAKLQALFTESGTRSQALGAQGASPEEIREEMARSRARRASEIEALLTPDQRDRFRALRRSLDGGPPAGRAAAQPGRVWIVGADGEPEPVAIRIGISDGTMTEVVSGPLTEGQEIIIGIAAASSAPPPATTGFRF